MVKFVGGPSVNAYKSYKNHTIAREGQWRMPRAYGSVRKEVKINIREYNYQGNSYGGWGGFQLPGWLQWASFGMNWLNQIIPQRQAQQDTNPFAANPLQGQLDDMQAEIDKLKKENEELKKKKVEEPKKEETKPVDINANVDLLTEEVETVNTTPDKVEETTVQVNNTVKVIKKAQGNQNGVNEGYTWASLQNAYVAEDGTSVPNSSAFRNWFRENYLNNATDIGVGQQHYPKEITYQGKTYKFDTDKYKPMQYDTNAGYGGSSAKTQKGENIIKGTTTTDKSWKGSATATWTDKDGKTQTKTVPLSGYGTKEELITALKEKIKDEVPSDAKITYKGKES